MNVVTSLLASLIVIISPFFGITPKQQDIQVQVATTTVTPTVLPTYMLTSLQVATEQKSITPNGYIKILVTGGLPPYRFSAVGGAIFMNKIGGDEYYFKAGGKEGNATITAIDTNGATATTSIYVVTALKAQQQTIYTTVGKTVSLTPKNGKAPYTYTVAQGAGTVSKKGIYTSPQSEDTSYVQVKDAIGQSYVVQIVTKGSFSETLTNTTSNSPSYTQQIPSMFTTQPYQTPSTYVPPTTSFIPQNGNSTDGMCGASHLIAFTSMPVTALCSQGVATQVTGNGPWSWSCNGVNGGGSVGCFASRVDGSQQSGGGGDTNTSIAGICGASNNASIAAMPTEGFCSSGTASQVTGTGPWFWGCTGSPGAQSSECSTYIPDPTDP